MCHSCLIHDPFMRHPHTIYVPSKCHTYTIYVPQACHPYAIPVPYSVCAVRVFNSVLCALQRHALRYVGTRISHKHILSVFRTGVRKVEAPFASELCSPPLKTSPGYINEKITKGPYPTKSASACRHVTGHFLRSNMRRLFEFH